MRIHFLLIPLLALSLSQCTAETRGFDSDGDGLSDKQEAMFGTDPYLADTNGNTIPDALDPNPVQLPALVLIPSIIHYTSDEAKASAIIQVAIKDELDRWVSAENIAVSTSFGTLSPITPIGTGFFEFELSSNTSGNAEIHIQTTDLNGIPDNRAQESILVELKINTQNPTTQNPDENQNDDNDVNDDEPPKNPGDKNQGDENNDTPIVNDNPDENQGNENQGDEKFVLEFPGLNPGQYQNEGSIDGDLVVMAVDDQSLDWANADLMPYPGAFVQVDLPDGSTLTGNTNSSGWIHFKDSRLKPPVTVTVGAKNARYMTWYDVHARVVSAPIHPRDITPDNAETQGAAVTGVVRGFWGETGLNSFPRQNTNVFGTINIAIVQPAIRNTPLSSMNTGSILLAPDGKSTAAQYFEIPPNLVLCNLSNPEASKFTLRSLKPGKYVLFALAGAGGNIMTAVQNPYQLKFTPMALGIKQIEVKPGQTLNADIDLNIDLRTDDVDKASLYLGNFPNDPKTGQPLPMGLVLPLINTGFGYIFIDINSAWNFENFKNPVSLIYPRPVHAVLKNLGLDVHQMVVGLAARKAQAGFDLPGISTLIMHPQSSSSNGLSSVYMNDPAKWPNLPGFVTPKPPVSNALDAVGDNLYPSRKIAWTVDDNTDMTVIRLNYMTPPIHNKLLNTDIGAAQAHLLWELFVPSPARQITLPDLPASAPDFPVLKNYAPTVAADAYQYDENTIEIEINAYRMGPKQFQYNKNFLVDDTNMNAWAVSQDSYLVSVKQ